MAKKKGTKYRKTVTVGRDINGKPIRKDFYGATKAELNEKIEDYKYNMRANINDKRLLDVDFEKWSDIWYESYKRGQVEMGTSRSIESVLRKLCGHFGEYKIRSIKEADVMRFFKANNHLTTGYLKKLYGILKQVFDKAVANDIITKSPMANFKPPTGKGKDVEKKSYTYDEYRKAIDFAKTHPDGLGPFIMLKTGVRLSELLGLKGSDIDFENGLIHVRRTSTDQGFKDRGKTATSLRSIPVDAECLEFLSDHVACHVDDFLFKAKTPARKPNLPKKPSAFREHEFEKFQTDLLTAHPEMQRMTPHEYRHTYGTLLYQSGTELLTLSRIMGHSNTLVTQKTYVHDTINDVINNVRFPSESLREKEKSVKVRDGIKEMAL